MGYDIEKLSSCIFSTIFSLLGLLVVIGTVYDVFVIHQLHATSEYDELDTDESEPLILGSQNNSTSRNIRYRGYSSIPTENGGNQEKEKKHIQAEEEIGTLEIGIILLFMYCFL